MKKGCKFGSHRVLEPKGVMPQACWRLDNNFEEIYDNEILVDVDRVNIDAASFHQIRQQARNDEEEIRRIILQTVAERGKQHNPVTGSGGMFTGAVRTIGPAIKDQVDLKPGDRIASLVSLALTPLKINRIKKLTETDQVEVEAQAVLFERTVYARLPENRNETLAMAVLDVAGAPSQTARLVKPGQTVLIVGAGGKSGLLAACTARKILGRTGCLIGTGHSPRSTKRLEEAGFCHIVIQADAINALELERKVAEITQGRLADLVINCASVPDTEMACILAAKPDGLVYFFNMAVNFNKAALGAEGVASEATLIIGNGYVKNHARFALDLIEENDKIRTIFEEIYGPYYL